MSTVDDTEGSGSAAFGEAELNGRALNNGYFQCSKKYRKNIEKKKAVADVILGYYSRINSFRFIPNLGGIYDPYHT